MSRRAPIVNLDESGEEKDRETQSPNNCLTNEFSTENINEFTNQQLNTVSNMVKKIKENKMSEILDKK